MMSFFCRVVPWYTFVCTRYIGTGGVVFVEIYVEASGSLFEATAVAAKGDPVPPSFRYY